MLILALGVGGGVKPSNNATFGGLIKIFFEGVQVLLSRINEVHCGILEMIKRCRNKYGMTHLKTCVAFTLAETLVVMGIIGVVAALTIPNLNQSTGNREKVAKLKKIHSNLEDAFGRATAVYGPVEDWCVNDSSKESCNNRIASRLKDFLKLSKDCNTSRGCFSGGYVKDLNGSNASDEFDNCIISCNKFILTDGTSIATLCHNKNFTNSYANEDLSSPLRNIGATFIVDIDGPNKGKYQYGTDIFQFYLTKTAVVSACIQSSTCGEDIVDNCFNKGRCTGWIFETGNMDYLKADRNGKCPNGTTLSWENTSCK